MKRTSEKESQRKMFESKTSTNLSSESEEELAIKGMKRKQQISQTSSHLHKAKLKKVEEPSAEETKKKDKMNTRESKISK